MQKWLRQSEANDDQAKDQAELLIHLSRADNWFDLYKTVELTQGMNGGQHKLQEALAADGKEWDRVRRTANHYRHAPGSKHSTLPDNPPTFKEARDFVLRVVSRLLISAPS